MIGIIIITVLDKRKWIYIFRNPSENSDLITYGKYSDLMNYCIFDDYARTYSKKDPSKVHNITADNPKTI